jgi:3-deoxy-D-manno-octulosonate 8-phosphate phosphatase (KDO 8-P phosphatase)
MLYWYAGGKPFKAFGNYDHDGLKLLRKHLEIEFVSADEVGWPITESRIIEHMKFPCTMVKEKDRLDFVLNKGNPGETIFMGDGPFDAKIFPHVGLSIAPAQAWRTAISNATYVTPREGGKGAVMDACVYIMDKMGIEHGF